MKVILALSAVLSLAAAAALFSENESPLLLSTNSEELDEYTAKTLETFDFLVDDSEDLDDEDEFGQEGADDDIDDGALSEVDNRVLFANVTKDGMIEVEDMIVSPEMFEVLFPHITDHPENNGQQSIHKRAGVSSKSSLWPKGRIPYSYNSNLAGSKSKVREAMNEWEKYTCLKFQYRKSGESKYVQIRTKMDSKGKPVPVCSSALGHIRKRQYINLSKNCFSHRTLLHELGHTIGLIHEHQHPSRDQYVTIVWDNINPSKVSNFRPKKGVSSYGYPYDPTSIMHYRSTSFRKSGCKSPCNTITSKKGTSTTNMMGRAGHLSAKSDIPVVKKMYNCPRTSG